MEDSLSLSLSLSVCVCVCVCSSPLDMPVPIDVSSAVLLDSVPASSYSFCSHLVSRLLTLPIFQTKRLRHGVMNPLLTVLLGCTRKLGGEQSLPRRLTWDAGMSAEMAGSEQLQQPRFGAPPMDTPGWEQRLILLYYLMLA
jgi:hypothetical protein